MQGFDKIFQWFRRCDHGENQDGCQQPYLSMDRNHFWADTTRPLMEHLRKVSKKSDLWSRRCDNEIVSVKGHFAI